jgi:hypothetical protein
MDSEEIAFNYMVGLCNEKLKILVERSKTKQSPIGLSKDSITLLERLASLSPQKNIRQKYICSIINSLRSDDVDFVLPMKKKGRRVSLPKFQDQWCDLSYLICSSFSISESDWLNFLNSNDYCNKDELCTEIGKKLSNSLVKIASTRIFSKPEQSILELPVNSLDAYGKGSNVGKFGMGFFSILYWLVGNPKRSMVIDSCYMNDFNELQKYTCYVKYSSNKLMFKLSNESERDTPGVTVSIDCSQDKFTDENLVQFGKQLRKLEWTTSAGIYVNSPENKDYVLFNQCKFCDDKVFVSYNSNGIRVSDDATGIPLKVLMLKLFTPSISTKTIKLSQQPLITYQNDSKYFKSEKNHFIILVNKVAIVDLQFETDDVDKFTIIIDLPSNTRVPVSRDDIILNESTNEHIKSSINIILQTCIHVFNSIYPLNAAISSYITYSVNKNNKDFFKSIWNNYLEILKNQYIFIDFKYSGLFKQISLSKPYLTIDYTDVGTLNRHLSTEVKFYDDVFVAKKVIYLTKVEGSYTSAGMNDFFFIEYGYTKKFRDWPIQISLLTLSDTLIPKYLITNSTGDFGILDHKVRKEFNNVLNQLPNNITPSDRLPYQSLLQSFGLKYIALKTRFTLTDEYLSDYLSIYTNTANFIYQSLGYEIAQLQLNLYMERFGLLRPIMTYGNERPSFYPFYTTILGNSTVVARKDLSEIFIKNPVSEKLKAMTVEWIKYSSQMSLTEYMFLRPDSYLPVYLVYRHLSYYRATKATLADRELYGEDLKVSFILSKALEVCNDCYELNLIYQILMYMNYQLDRDKDKDRVIRDYINEIYLFSDQDIMNLSEFMIEITKLNYIDTKSLYNPEVDFTSPKLGDWRYSFLIEPNIILYLLTPIELKINQMSKKETLPLADTSVFNIPTQYIFTESQLIDTALTENFTTLKELFHLSSTNVIRNRLQITEIAINEGSTKSISNSVVTETVQNSLDAIRTFLPANPTIDIKISTSGNDLIFSITDYVGINDKGIIATMIPFLSSKTPSEIVTGEMGSGFFNIYRESKKVLIETHTTTTKTLILDTPISQKDRVIDIERQVSITNEQNETGKTTISAWYEIEDSTKRTDMVSNFLNIIRYTIGLIQGANIRLNDQNIEIPVISLNSNNYFDFNITNLPEININSYIFTKGVPFAPLKDYFDNKDVIPQFLLSRLGSNTVLNIKHGIFTPVQTRGSLNISDENLSLLRNFLIDSVYLKMLQNLSFDSMNDSLNQIISNFTSKASINQLLFNDNLDPITSNSLNIFMVNYSYNNNKTIATLIKECSVILGNSLFVTRKEELNRFLQTQTDVALIKSTVMRFLSTKNQKDDSVKQTHEKEDDNPDKEKDKKFLEEIFSKFIKIYWENGRKLGINGFEASIPSCNIEPLKQTLLGFYKRDKHSVTLNLNVMKDQSDFIKIFRSKNLLTISKTSIFSEFLAYSLPASTLIHELEHARRHSSHNEEGSHDAIEETFPGQAPEIYKFEDSANKVYDLITKNTDLFSKWIS